MKKDFPNRVYLRKENNLCYPNCLFSASRVSHVTDKSGLRGIFEDEGFRGGPDHFLWWDLSMTAAECVNAKVKLGSKKFSWQSPNQMPSLEQFTTSPAFQSESRFGNFRFTLPLTELLKIYSKQYCGRTSPILRVMDTRLYKQEIQYSVLVHPRYMTHYRKYPRLPIDDNFLCGYSQRKMSWHCQSPSDSYTHCMELDNEGGENYPRPLERPEYFVWDHVAVAFHMKRDWVLKIDREGHGRLCDSLSACEMASNNPEMSLAEAEAEVENLRNLYL